MDSTQEEMLGHLMERAIIEDPGAYELVAYYHALSSEDNFFLISMAEHLNSSGRLPAPDK